MNDNTPKEPKLWKNPKLVIKTEDEVVSLRGMLDEDTEQLTELFDAGDPEGALDILKTMQEKIEAWQMFKRSQG